MRPGGVFGKLFMGRYYFTIALREKHSYGLLDGKPFCAKTVLPANKDNWSADPFLVDDEYRTWLFYEAVKGEKGRIEVAEIQDGCKLSKPTVILEDKCHYSYPLVFRADEQWYMIPESSASGEVRLYRATEFPYKWEQQEVLLRSCAVDTTVFFHDGCYWLLTFLKDDGTERVSPRAYKLSSWSAPKLCEVPWPDYDPLRVRGAGNVIHDGNKLLRPAQISRENRYGDGLAFFRAEPGELYRETMEFEISQKDVKAAGKYIDGLHTYNSSARYEAIDIRCREADPFKLIKRLLKR